MLVDTTAPEISSVTIDDGNYGTRSELDVTVNFSEAVIVTGDPRLALTIGGRLKYAFYEEGSESSTLIFRYMVEAGINDANGIEMTSLLQLNSGTIVDGAGNDLSPLTFTPPSNLNLVLVDTTAPEISSLTIASGSYKEGDNLDVSVVFNEQVWVDTTGGTPRLSLTIGSQEKEAAYVLGSESSTLIFRYTVQGGLNDTDGIVVTSPLQPNSGTIKDATGNDLSPLTFTSPSNLGEVLVDTTAPEISSLTIASGSYKEGDNLDVTVNFSETVVVTGTPQIALDIGGSQKYAVYTEGTDSEAFTFRYTVQGGLNDTDGIVVTSPLQLNSGAIEDATGNDLSPLTFTSPSNLGEVLVDTTAPEISSVTVISGSYKEGDNLDVTVNFSETVVVTGTPQIALDIGGSQKYAVYTEGTDSEAFTFRYRVEAGLNDTDGIGVTSLQLNSGAIEDATGNDLSPLTFTSPSNLGEVLVDTTAPEISSVSINGGSYGAPSHLDISIAFSEAVIVTGNPRIALDIGGSSKYAVYTEGTNSAALTFRYVVESGFDDSNGIEMTSPLELNSGTIVDFAENALSALAFNPPSNLGEVLIDSTILTISSVSVTDGSYLAGSHLDVSVTFNKDIVLNATAGTPRISLTIGSTQRYADYVSKTGSATLIFRYTVVSGDNDPDGIEVTSPLELNSGVLQDNNGDNIEAGGLIFTPPRLSAVLVDTTPPNTFSVSVGSGSYRESAHLDVTVIFDEAVTVTGFPQIALTVGTDAKYAVYEQGSESSTLIFRYTVEGGFTDTNGIEMTSPLELNSGVIADLAGNAMDNFNFTVPSLGSVLVDTTLPTISSVAAEGGTYISNANLDVTVTFSEAVFVTGSPQIALTVGTETKYAVYEQGSESSTLTFRYTVEAGFNDADGIAVGSPLELNSGTIKDAAENDLSPLTFTPPSLPTVIVDTSAPTISSVSVASGSYKESSHLDVSVTLSEAVNVTGNPRIALDIGGDSNKYATYSGGTGSSTLTFRYTVASGDNDSNGIEMTSSLELNSGTIADLAGNAMGVFSLTTPSNLGEVLVDTTAPTILSVAAVSGSYGVGSQLDVVVTFSEPVVNRRSDSTVFINWLNGIGGRNIPYGEGSGTAKWIFRVRIEAGWIGDNGIHLISPLGSIYADTYRDRAGNNANLNFTPSVLSTVLLDTTLPSIRGVSVASGTYGETSSLDVVVAFSEIVQVLGTPHIVLNIGGQTRYASYHGGSGSAQLIFRYTVASTDSDGDGIAMEPRLELHGGVIRDIARNSIAVVDFLPSLT